MVVVEGLSWWFLWFIGCLKILDGIKEAYYHNKKVENPRLEYNAGLGIVGVLIGLIYLKIIGAI